MWVEICWPESQDLFEFCDNEGYEDNVVATNESGCYLVNEEWLNEQIAKQDEE